jgi:HEAT repeat protein
MVSEGGDRREMRRSTGLLATAGILLAAVALVYGWPWLFPAAAKPTPDELAEIALTAPAAGEREAAAVALIPMGESAVVVMRRVLDQSDKPEVRSAMIQGLIQQWDLESMPVFLAAMNDESPLVRMRAAGAVRRVFLDVAIYREDDPPEARKAAIEVYRSRWESLRASPAYDKILKRLKERAH